MRVRRHHFGPVIVAAVVAVAAGFLVFLLATKESPQDKLKTICAPGIPPTRISEVRHTYFYTCPDGTTGWVG